MTELRKVTHGPFSGYVSSISRDLIPPDAIGPDSRDWRYNPTLGKWVERGGSAVLGDTYVNPVGLLEQKSNYRCRQLFELPSVKAQDGTFQSSDGYPTYGALYDADSFYVYVGVSTTPLGALYIRNRNSSQNRSMGDGYSETTYPTSTRNGVLKSYLKAMPTWYGFTKSDGTSINLAHRLGSGVLSSRQYLYAGGRRLIIIGNWLYTVGLRCSPLRWNMLYNDSTSAPTRKERHYHIGIVPVLYPAYIKTADLPTADPHGTWESGDTFCISAQYVFEDGTCGPLFIPSITEGTKVTGGMNDQNGRVTLDTTVAPGTRWQYIKWSNIAQGSDPSIKGTRILRGPKVNILNAPGSIPRITDDDGNLDLRVIAFIPKGTTSYNDYSGSDTALLVDTERVRADHISCPRARYIGAFDGRAVVGYTLPNPNLIYLAHTGTTAPNDNTDDDDTALSATAYFVQVSGTDLKLRKKVIGGGAVADNTISMSGKTLSEVVALVNATTVASTTGEWRAQLAPGVDGSLPSSIILNTSVNGSFFEQTLTGDVTIGNMDALTQGCPACLMWKQSELASRYPNPDREGFWFTRAAPQSAAVGITSAPNLWVAGNYRKPPEYSGVLMGFAPFNDGMAVFYTEKVWVFRNTLSGRSGRDEDYRFDLLSNDGCIAWDSIVSFNNAVGWLSRKGYKVSGGVSGDERVITGAIYDPTEEDGDLSYEVAQCLISASADDGNQRFHAQRFGHSLVIKYRSSESVTVPDLEHEYDFSEGAQSGGLAELLRPDGTPFGWSAPFTRPGEAMGEYRGPDGLVKLHAIEQEGSTGDGRIDQIETGYMDNGVAIEPVWHSRTDDQGEIRKRKRERRFSLKYRCYSGHVMTVTHYRDRRRLSSTTYTMDDTGTLAVSSQTKRIKLEGQAPARVSEYKITGTRTSVPAEIWMLERELKVLDTPVERVAG